MKTIYIVAFASCITLVGCSSDDPVDPVEGGAWQTMFEDDFNATTLDPKWTLEEGNTDNYVLDGSTIAIDDTPANQEGPLFIYNESITDNVIRMTCKLSTLAMTGEIQFGMLVRGIDIGNTYAAFMSGDDLAIAKFVSGTGSLLAASIHPAMGSNETRIMECRYENGTISFIARDAGGNEIGSVTATDPSPLVGGRVGFDGEVDNTDNEYLYLDDFKLERYE